MRKAHDQHDRIVFAGRDLGPLVSCVVERPIMAPTAPKWSEIPGRDGDVFKSMRRAGYDLTVTMYLRTEERRDVAEARHRLAAALYTDEPAPLYLPDDPTRHLMAVVSGDTDLGEITDECPSCDVTFHVMDPDYYGRERTAYIGTTHTQVDAGGTRPSWPDVECRPGACSSWRIENETTGEHVEVRAPIAVDSVVRISMADERATINGRPAAVTLASDFFSIEGLARLRVSSGEARLVWHERWL